jgi:ABC-type dipeptide/oligopeptide/nickel transport system ATPase component
MLRSSTICCTSKINPLSVTNGVSFLFGSGKTTSVINSSSSGKSAIVSSTSTSSSPVAGISSSSITSSVGDTMKSSSVDKSPYLALVSLEKKEKPIATKQFYLFEQNGAKSVEYQSLSADFYL